jgi:8-oxo-dGTP pyrophosphatase MutT (NUDIX family)
MFLDRAIRLALWCVFRLQKIWWLVCRPKRTGAGVAVWYDGKLLLIRHSYKPGYFLPGGEIGRRETPVMAACRELGEEVGIFVDPGQLSPVDGTSHPIRLHDTFEFCPYQEPNVRIDNREIIEARFVGPLEANSLRLNRQLREYMAASLANH